jgi:hypothetical protein
LRGARTENTDDKQADGKCSNPTQRTQTFVNLIIDPHIATPLPYTESSSINNLSVLQMSQQPDPNSVNYDNSPAKPDNSQEQDSLSLMQMFGSALAAMVGVQSKEKRERDFAKGKASHFIIVGVVLTALFVLTMAGLVTLVINVAT